MSLLSRRACATAFALVCLLALTGCWVYTANPLAERDEDTMFDVNLLGNWWQPDSGCSLVISRLLDENTYHLHYAAPREKKGNGCLLDEGRSAAFAGDRKSTRLNSSHLKLSRMPSSA